MNKYGIPEDFLKKIRKRDKLCVYCRKEMIVPRKGTTQRNWATIEHMSDKKSGNEPQSIVICCGSCNSSRRMSFEKWFKTPYCMKRNINAKTVAKPVKDYMRMIAGLSPKKRKQYVLKYY
ncbi:MAG: HNH endonuclease [Candidatus Taylorbacteria bacterium]